MSQKLHELLHTPMSRKAFLRYCGVMVISVVGISSLLKNFTEFDLFKKYPHQTKGYGASNYGGVENEKA